MHDRLTQFFGRRRAAIVRQRNLIGDPEVFHVTPVFARHVGCSVFKSFDRISAVEYQAVHEAARLRVAALG